MIFDLRQSDARNRWVTIIYITSCLLSCSSAIGAPLQLSSYDHGQPEYVQNPAVEPTAPPAIVPDSPSMNLEQKALNTSPISKQNDEEAIAPADEQQPTARTDDNDEVVRELRELSKSKPESKWKRSVEAKKLKLETELIHDVTELERLGETQEDILHTLQLDSYRFNGPHASHAAHQRNPYSMRGSHFDQGNQGRSPQARVDEIYRNNKMTNYPSWRQDSMDHLFPPPRPYFSNNTIQETHPSQKNQRMLARHYQKYPSSSDYNSRNMDGIKNTIHRLQKQHQIFLANQIHSNHKETRDKENPAHDSYPPAAMKPPFGNPEYNSTSLRLQEDRMPPYESYNYQNHKIEKELNEDMRRELRDGKVVLLSDSVVHSNFGASEAQP